MDDDVGEDYYTRQNQRGVEMIDLWIKLAPYAVAIGIVWYLWK